MARWVIANDVPSGVATDKPTGTVAPLMRALKADPARQAAGVFVADALEGLWRNDHRTISSVYATAGTLIWAFVDPNVATATAKDGDLIDPDLFLNGTGTLYVCLPLTDEGRLRPVLGGALVCVVAAVYEHHHMARRELPRGEALLIHGNLPPAHVRPLRWRRRQGGPVVGTRWRGLSGLSPKCSTRRDGGEEERTDP